MYFVTLLQKKGVPLSKRKFDNAKDNIIPSAIGPVVDKKCRGSFSNVQCIRNIFEFNWAIQLISITPNKRTETPLRKVHLI